MGLPRNGTIKAKTGWSWKPASCPRKGEKGGRDEQVPGNSGLCMRCTFFVVDAKCVLFSVQLIC